MVQKKNTFQNLVVFVIFSEIRKKQFGIIFSCYFKIITLTFNKLATMLVKASIKL